MRADAHPEGLIDRARQDALSPDERATLDRHLAACTACSAHLSLARRFEREVSTQSRDPVLDRRAVAAAMMRLQQSPPARRRAVPSWFRWAAAAALLVVGVTGAAAVIGRRLTGVAVIQSLPPSVQPPLTRPPVRAAETPAIEAPPPPVSSSTSTSASASASAQAPSRRSGPPTITAAALLERGEKLRREGHLDAAIATYRRLQTTFPETPETRLSYALAGQLLLTKGHPDDALVLFERHLKVGGAADEEALAGRATALEHLHRTADAIAAWKDLLARHPGSVYAERARTRLDQLVERR